MYDMKDFLHLTNLPKLTHLSVHGDEISQLFITCELGHVGVTRLELDISTHCGEEDVQAASKIVYLFPSVTAFEMKLKLKKRAELALSRLEEIMDSFRPWRGGKS